MLNYLVASLVEETVDVVVVGSLLVDRELINSVGSLEDSVCKAVGEVEGRKSPYLC